MGKSKCLIYFLIILTVFGLILFTIFYGFKRIGRGNQALILDSITNKLSRD